MMPRLAGAFSVFGLVAAAFMLSASPLSANWLTHILREAGEAGGKAGSHVHPVPGAMGRALRHLDHAPPGSATALAAHATPEGHWQFSNRGGQTFTAGTPDEMQRMLPSLVPEAAAARDGKLALYLTEDSAFAGREMIDQLPKDATLLLATDAGALPLTRGGGVHMSVQIKPNITYELTDRRLFDEALAMLSRPLNTSGIRTLAMEPGAAKALSSAPRFDPETKQPLVDAIDPDRIANALRALKGQSALVVGRIEDGRITFRPASGGEVTRDVALLTDAAAANDVNLILLHADAPRQPGGRNWLWQTIEVGGLSDAMRKATFGDFLDALGAKRGAMQLSAAEDGLARVRLTAVPSPDAAGIVTSASDLLSEAIGHVAGEVVVKAVEVRARDKDRQMELDGRLIPGVPVAVQIFYLAGVFGGVIGWGTSRAWWRRLWPDTGRATGQGWLSYVGHRIARELVFFAGFLPVAGRPAFATQAAVNTWVMITAPFRWLRRIFRRAEV
ncbi:MAG: hypothetical protein ACRCS9_01310 [Hyphomicrobium sp.]